MDETRRKLIHISGIIFILLAQFTGKWIAALYFFMIAATFLLYSEHVRREKEILHRLLNSFEHKIRDLTTKFERDGVARPFLGAFWFHFSCGLTFLIFPLHIASAACMMLAIGDGMSTILGQRFGKKKLVGKKSWIGSATMFVFSAITAMLFVPIHIALLGAIIATIAELLPDIYLLENHKKRGLIDDNLLVPMLSGAVMLAASLF